MRRFALLVLLLLVAPAAAETAMIDFNPCLIMDDIGAPGAVNNYTMLPAASSVNASWNLIGANSQNGPFTVLDSRYNETIIGGTQFEYHIGNTQTFQYYYLYLLDGFPIGEVLEWHLNETIAPGPTAPWYELLGPDLNWTLNRRAPLVAGYNMTGDIIGNYTITLKKSSDNIRWYIFGTNETDWLGDSAALAQLDTQTAVMVVDVPQTFEFASTYAYSTYLFWFDQGMTEANGNLVNMRFGSGIPLGPVAPAVVGNFTPVFNVTTVVHQNQTFVKDRAGGTPMPVWIGSVVMGMMLLLVSCVIPFPRGEEGLVSIMSWFPIGYAVFTAFKIDAVTGYGVTSYAGEFVLMEQHILYHFDVIAAVLLVVLGFAIGNTYRIWVTQKQASAEMEVSWHDRHGGL